MVRKGNIPQTRKLILSLIFIVAIICMQCFELHFSALLLEYWQFAKNPFLLLINIGIMVVPNLFLVAIIGNWILSLGITSIVCTVLSVANYYVMAFHGTPITVTELANFKTALNVVEGYDFFVDRGILYFTIAFIAEMLGVFILYKLTDRLQMRKGRNRIVSLGLMLLDIGVLYIGLFSSFAVKP